MLSDATRLRRHRQRLGLTLRQLEKLSGVSDSMLSAIECGRKKLSEMVAESVKLPTRERK